MHSLITPGTLSTRSVYLALKALSSTSYRWNSGKVAKLSNTGVRVGVCPSAVITLDKNPSKEYKSRPGLRDVSPIPCFVTDQGSEKAVVYLVTDAVAGGRSTKAASHNPSLCCPHCSGTSVRCC